MKQNSRAMNDFYVYGLFYEDENKNSVCFYIGSGTGDRKERHFQEGVMRNCSNTYKINKIKKLRRNGKKLCGKKLVDNLTKNEARKLEQKLLNKDEVFNNTTNLNRLATGFSGKFSEETKEKIRRSQLGHKNNAKDREVREKISETLKNREDNVGSKNPQSKFNEEEVREVRQLWNEEEWRQSDIANKYNCSQRTISKIVRNISYSDSNYENKRGKTIRHCE